MPEIDDETLRLIRGYFGRDPREPREVVETVFYESGGEEWSLDTFLAAIGEAASEIPPERRHTAKVWLSDESTYLTITYTRMETPEEVAENVARGLAYARDRLESERATYEALKRKFDRPSNE